MIYNKEQDIEFMKAIARQTFAAAIVKNYGEDQLSDLAILTDVISTMYKYVNLTDEFDVIVFKTSNEAKSIKNSHSQLAIKITDLSLFASKSSTQIVLEISNNNELWVIWNGTIDPRGLVEDSIVYHFRNGTECIYEKDCQPVALIRPPDVSSYFAFPTFKRLDTALEHYRMVRAQRSNCRILNDAWLNSNKVFFSPRPEEKMRQSLYDYLSTYVRAEVREEQNVNDSEPVDIKITWGFSSHIALIEIKWLGKSIEHIGRAKFNQEYYDRRANEGAKQLSDYLDENKQYTPQNLTVGYLVVFDARRWQTNENTITINRANGFYYENKEIVYNPDYHQSRTDFGKPVRFFLEPYVTI